MHNALAARSKRLYRVLGVLRDRKPHSTMEIQRMALVCAVGTCVSELRACGYQIACHREGDAWWYTLTSEPEEKGRAKERAAR